MARAAVPRPRRAPRGAGLAATVTFVILACVALWHTWPAAPPSTASRRGLLRASLGAGRGTHIFARRVSPLDYPERRAASNTTASNDDGAAGNTTASNDDGAAGNTTASNDDGAAGNTTASNSSSVEPDDDSSLPSPSPSPSPSPAPSPSPTPSTVGDGDNNGCGAGGCAPTNSTLAVTLPYSIDTFTPALRTRFRKAVAKVAGVTDDKVAIADVAESSARRRQLLGANIDVTFVVTAPSQAAATSITLALRDTLNSELRAQGVARITAIKIPAENFCASASSTDSPRHTCKNLDGNTPEYHDRCMWDMQCGCFDKACGGSGQCHRPSCNFKCSSAYPTLDCDESGPTAVCSCLVPEGSVPGGEGGVEGDDAGDAASSTDAAENQTVSLAGQNADEKQENATGLHHQVRDVASTVVKSAIRSVCADCLEAVCEVTESLDWTCDDGLAAVAGLVLIGTIAVCCSCCCCCGAPAACFYRRRGCCLRCCPCLVHSCIRCCPCLGGYSDVFKRAGDDEEGERREQGAAEESAAITIQKRARGMISRRKTAEIFVQQQEEDAAIAIQKRVRGLKVRRQQSTFKPVASAATLEHAGKESEAMNLAITVTIELDMRISESGEEGSEERAKFKILLVRELAEASGVQKKFFLIHRIAAGSIIVDVEICADPSPYEHAHCPSQVAADLIEQAQDEQSQLLSGTLMARLVSISVLEHGNSEMKKQHQAGPAIPSGSQISPHYERSVSPSFGADLPVKSSPIQKKGNSAPRSRSRSLSVSVNDDAAPEPACEVNRAIKKQILKLHGRGKSVLAITNHHSLLEHELSEAVVEAVVSEAKAARATNGGANKEHNKQRADVVAAAPASRPPELQSVAPEKAAKAKQRLEASSPRTNPSSDDSRLSTVSNRENRHRSQQPAATEDQAAVVPSLVRGTEYATGNVVDHAPLRRTPTPTSSSPRESPLPAHDKASPGTAAADRTAAITSSSTRQFFSPTGAGSVADHAPLRRTTPTPTSSSSRESPLPAHDEASLGAAAADRTAAITSVITRQPLPPAEANTWPEAAMADGAAELASSSPRESRPLANHRQKAGNQGNAVVKVVTRAAAGEKVSELIEHLSSEYTEGSDTASVQGREEVFAGPRQGNGKMRCEDESRKTRKADARISQPRLNGNPGNRSFMPRRESVNLFEEFDLTDDMEVLAENGIKCNQDFSYLDDNVIQEMKYLSPVTKAKLRKLVTSLEGHSTVGAHPENWFNMGQNSYSPESPHNIPASPHNYHLTPSFHSTSSVHELPHRRSSPIYQDGALYHSSVPSAYANVTPSYASFNAGSFDSQLAASAAAAAAVTAVITATKQQQQQHRHYRMLERQQQLAEQEHVLLQLKNQQSLQSLGGNDTPRRKHALKSRNSTSSSLCLFGAKSQRDRLSEMLELEDEEDREARTGGNERPSERVASFRASSPINSFSRRPGLHVREDWQHRGAGGSGAYMVQDPMAMDLDLALLENYFQAASARHAQPYANGHY